MNKKTLFAIFMLFACAFVFMTGKSDWLIIEDYETQINTSYYPVSITGEKETTYNGNYLPFTENDVEVDNSSSVEFDTNLLEFVYYESIEDDNIKKMDHAPVNVGQYFVDVKYDSELISTISYVINPCDVYIKLNDNTITYGDAPTANGYSLYSDNAAEAAFTFPTNVLENTQDTIGNIVYSYSYKQYGTVGNYSISIDFNSSKLNSNYTFYQIDKSKLTVNKKDINFTWEDNYSWEYDGVPHHPSATLDPNGIVNKDQIVLEYNGVHTNASDTAYTVELLNNLTNYNIIEDENNKFTKDYYITRREVTASWDNNTEFTYDNTNKKQAPAVTLGNLVDGEALTPVYEYYELIDGSYTKISSMPHEVGSYKVVLAGLEDGANGLASNYKLPEEAIEKEFVINPLEVTINWENNEVTYNGENQYITVIPGDYKANDYKIVYNNDEEVIPFNAETYSVKFVTTNKNYTILNNSDETTFIINPKQIDLTWSGDKEVDLGIGMEYKGANTPVGPTPSLDNTQICEYDITNNTLEVYIIDSTKNALANANYEGTEAFASKYTAEATLNNSNYVINNNKTCDYYVLRALMDSYFTNINARTTIIPDFEFVYNAEAQIPTAYINESMLMGDDAAFTPIVTPTLDGNETESINVGNYLATITGLNNNNYELTANNTATYTISPKVVGAEWTNNVVDYNGNSQTPTLTITGLCGTDSVNGTISYSLDGNIVSEAKNAGIYTVTVASLDNSNYRLPTTDEDSYDSITSTFTINKLKLNITANDHTITYGDSAANNGVSYAGFLTGEDETVLIGELVYSYDGYIIGSSVGTYNITVTGLEGINYEITYLPGTLTVEQLELQISWGNTSLEYNGNPQAPSPVFTNTLSGDNVEANVTGQESEVGNDYTATISSISGNDSLNYKLPSDVSTTYNIIPKTIYLTKWDTTSYAFDGNNHYATATLSGVIADEDCYVTTTSYRNVGEYTVTAELAGANKGNYVLDKEYTVILEITPMDIAISWSNLEFTYDGKAHKPTATLPALIGNDQVTITVTGEQTNAGNNYTAGIELAGENKVNYNVTNPTQKFIINKAPLTVTANNHTITYGDSATNNGVIYTGFVNGETEAVLNITNLSYTYGDYSVGSNVGSYSITPAGIIAANYEISYVNGTLTVIAKDVTAEWAEEEEYIYSGVNQGPTAKVIGINNTELNVTITYDSKDAGARTASLSLSGDDALNYNITNPICNYVIEKKDLAITANDYELIYGAEVPQFEVSYEGFVNRETEEVLTGTLVFNTNYVRYANIGDYYINISGLASNNYDITYTPGNIKVNECSLTITWGVTSFVYNGEVQGPSATAEGLNNDQLTVNVTYDGVTVGQYTASATLEGEKAYNYVISNPTTTYEITKAIYDMSKVSFADNTVTYNGEAHNITITGELPAGVTVEYEYKLNDTIIPLNEVINAGTYNVTAKFTGDSVNYELIENMTAVLTINKKEYNVSSLTWNYTEAFTYDKTEKSVELSSIPTGLTPEYVNDSAINAGDYTATVTFKYNEDNYIVTGVVAELEWVINKAVVTAPENDETVFTYNGTEHTYTLETSDLYTISGDKQTNAGTYTVTVTLVDSNNYKWSDDMTNPLEYEFIITKAKLDKPEACDTVFTYNGLDQTYTLVENDNYTISNNVQKNANTYTVLVEINDKDNYEWSDGTTDDLTFEFIINQATIDLSKAEWNYANPFIYDKKEHEVVLSTIPANITITSYSNNKATNAGNYTATVNEFTYDTVNYKLSGEIPSCSWVINKATIEAPVEDTTVYTYTGLAQTYNIPENDNYTVENNVQTDAGTYIVTVSLNDSDNYEWSDNKTNPLEYVFTINKANYEMTDVSFINTTQTYTGSALAITAENVPSGLNETYKYYQNDTEIPAENVINAGTYKVIVSFTDTTGNYNDPADIETTLVIEKAQAVITVDQTPIVITYGDELIIPEASTNFGEVKCDKTLADMKNAGNYTITYTVEGTENYIGDEKTVSVTINKAKVEKPEADNTIYTYNGSEQEYQLADNSLYTITGNKQTNAGTYTVKVSLNDTTNYVWSDDTNEALEYSFVINKMTVSEPTVVGTYTYDTNEQTVELSGLESYMTIESGNTGTNAGIYTVVIKLDNNHTWAEGSDGNITWEIVKATYDMSNVKFNDLTVTYDGNEHKLEITGELPAGVSVSYSDNTLTNVGNITVTAAFTGDADNYNLINSMTAVLSITPASIEGITFTGNTITYDEKAHSIYIEGTLPNGVTVSYENNDQTNVGEYVVTAKFADSTGNYTVPQDMQATLEITKAQAVITVDSTEIIVKFGENIEIPEASSNFGEVKIETVEMINVGNYEITYSVDETNNYYGATATVKVVINPKEVSEPTLADIGIYTYTGSPITVNLNGYDESYMNISNNTATNAATYEARVELNDNYIWAEGSDGIITWVIEKAQAVITVDQKPIVVTYGDTWSIPTASTNFGTVSCDKTLADMVDAGDYTITYTVEGTDNYYGTTATVAVKVNKKTVSEPTVVGTYTYIGLEQTVTLDGLESYMTVTNNTATNAGTYIVTVTLDNNHEWAEGSDGEISWTIAKKSLTITASSHNISYDDEAPTYSYTYEGFENNEGITDLEGTLSISCPYIKGDDVGIYTVTASGVTSNNYDITFETGTLNVERRRIDAPLANENEFIYNGEAQTYELASSKYYTISNNVQTDANTYTVEVTLISTTNCVWSDGTDSPLTYEFVIKQLEVDEPTVVGTYTYTGTAQTVTLNGLESYMTVTNNTGINAGEHTVTVTLDNNHTWANGSDGNISWTIEKAPLTITANSYTITYGEQAPTYEVAYDGFVNNEPTSVLTGTLAFTCSYVQGSKVDTYTITPSGLASNNYAITYVTGALTVNPIEVSEPTVSGTYTYNGNEQQVTLTGFNSSYMTIVSGDTGINAGDYTIVITLDENYTWADGSDGNVLWTIEKAIPSYELPTDITSTIGSKLEDVDLPDGFEWQNPETILNSKGEFKYLATYNLNDNNYAIVENIEITITVYQVLTMVINNAPVVYDGENHEIEITLYYNGEEVEQSEVVSQLTIVYKLNDTIITVPQAVGDYTVIINMLLNDYYMVEYNKQLTNNLTISNVNFSITLEKISVGDVTISYESTVRTWTQISSSIKEKLIFTDASGNVITLGSSDIISIDSMTNGIYTYDNTNTSTNVAGSTYLATLKLESSNYMLENDTILVKYQTVKVNGIYYTIEDALNNTSSGTITLAGSATSTTSYVETTFTNLENYPYNSYSYTINNRDLIVPYEDSTNYFNGTSVLNYNSSGKVYSALTINENIILSFTGSSKLVVAANIGYSQYKTTAACNRGVLVNDGTINMESGSTLYSYGYIKGTGLIDLKSGATAFDGMTIYDWPGGSAASSLYISSSVFPIKKWSLHHNACNTKINSNSTYMAYVYLIMNDSVVYQEFDIIGNSSSTNYMFKFNNDPDGYIMKSSTNANSNQSDTNLSSITGSNQVAGQREKLDIHGTVVDGSIKFSIKMILTVNIETDTDKAIGISYMDITIASGSDVTLGASSYSFLPGTKIEVEEGAKLTTNSGVKLQFVPLSEATNLSYTPVDQVDAKLINNGQVTINGNIGGLIETETTNAILNIAGSNSASIKLFKSSTDTYTVSVNAIGTIDGLNDQTFVAGGNPYVSTGEDGGYYWTQVSSDQIKEFVINYYDDDKSTLLGQKTIVTVGNDTVYTVTGGEFTANKLLYKFDTWINSNGVDVTLGTTTINAGDSINLYATWTPIEYTFVYTAGYEDNGVITDITSEIVLNEKIEKFTVNSFVDNVLTITTIAEYEGETTSDWYVGDSKTGDPVKQFTLDQFTTVLEEYNTTTIPLYCEFSSTKTYTISYDVSNYPQFGVTISSVPSMTITTLESKYLTSLTTYNNDTNYQYYLTGWTDGTNTYSLDKTISGALLSSDITLTAVWTKKYSITYEQGTQLNIDLGVITDFTKTTIYYIPSSKGISILPTLVTEQGHTFVEGWTDARVTDGTKTYSNNDTDITTSKFADGKTLYASYTVNTYTLTISEITNATVKVGGSTCSSGSSINATYGTSVEITFENGDDGSNLQGLGTDKNNKYYIKDNATISVIGKSCIAAGTLITLADGTQKKVEDLTLEDTLLVFNHETGEYEAAGIIFIENDGWNYYNVINLEFSNGITTRIIYEHALFDLTLNEYVYITEQNYLDFVGHEFAVMSNDSNLNYEVVIMTNAYVTNEYTGCYSLVTVYHLNYFIDGLFSIPGGITGLFNIFEYDNDTLVYNQELMQKDIETYGLYTYEDFEEYLPYEVYLAFPAPYLKVAVGKGMITFDEIIAMIDYYLVKNGVV